MTRIQITVRIGLQTDRNIAAGCVRKPRSHLHRVFPASLPSVRFCCRETSTTYDGQTAGFSVGGVFLRHGTDRQTDGRHTVAYLLYGRRSQRQ